MRITNNMLTNNMINYIGDGLGRMNKLQYKMATGKKISVPSDDPIIAARALKLRTDVAEIDQYKRNVNDAKSWMELTDDAFSKVGDIMQRTRELTVQGANGTNTVSDTMNIAAEIRQLKAQLVQLGNTKYSGRYIFSGYSTDQALLNEDGTFAIDVAGTENIKYEIGIGDDIIVNNPGGAIFNDGGDAVTGATGTLMNDFDDLINALDNGNTSAVRDMLTQIDSRMDNILKVRADLGAKVNRLDLTMNRLESDNLNFTELMSKNEDADMAEVIIQLKNEENVYNASLAAGARIIQPSLLDFLR